MRQRKREWVYAGLSIPPGVAVARPVGQAPKDQRRVLLVGGPFAQPLALPLSALAFGAQADLRVELRPEQSAYAWDRYGWLRALLQDFHPTAVLLAMEPYDPASARSLRDLAAAEGAKAVWLPPSGTPPHPGPVAVSGPRVPKPSAQDYAAWAGAAWNALA